MKRPILLFLLAIAPAIAASPQHAVAQSPPPQDALTEIATALTRIAEAMERQLEGGRLDLLMRRIEARQRQLNLVENQLRSAQREYEGYVQNVTRTEREISRLADREAAMAMGFDPASLDLHIESLEFDVGMTRQRVADLERRIADLEEQRARRQREVEDWQAFIDRELAGAP